MKEIVRKFLQFIIFYPVYYFVWFSFLGKELLENPLTVLIIALYFAVNFLDILIRPMTEREEMKNKYTIIIVLFFLSGPLIFILAFQENQIFVSTYFTFYNTHVTSIIGILLMIIGAIVLLTSRYQLNRHTYGGVSLSGEVDQKLLIEGMYKLIRHPMYAGGLIMTLGLQLALRSIIMLIIHVSVYLIIFKARMNREEEILQDRFGEDYTKYRKRTFKLIPYIY